MEQEKQKLQRKGLHKHFHVSKLDTYGYIILSLLFFILVVFKVANRLFDLGLSTAYINWKDTLQIAILWAILAFVSDMYYEKYERKYKK
jgi:hypothetical protein